MTSWKVHEKSGQKMISDLPTHGWPTVIRLAHEGEIPPPNTMPVIRYMYQSVSMSIKNLYWRLMLNQILVVDLVAEGEETLGSSGHLTSWSITTYGILYWISGQYVVKPSTLTNAWNYHINFNAVTDRVVTQCRHHYQLLSRYYCWNQLWRFQRQWYTYISCSWTVGKMSHDHRWYHQLVGGWCT